MGLSAIPFTIALCIITATNGLASLEHLERTQTARPVPPGWDFLGCYTDATYARTLRTASYTSVHSMTIESCLSYCQSQSSNFPYVGLEYGRECYCDTDLHAPAIVVNVSDCNMPCTGNANELCGSESRIAVYLRGPTAPQIKQTVSGTWVYKGCLRDSVSQRGLTHQIVLPSITAESCVAACQSRGFGLAGLEYRSECWCDNYLPYGQTLGDAACNMPCVGDASEFCGAANAIQIYQNSAAAPVNFSSCITGRSLSTFSNIQLQAILKTGPYFPIQIYATTLNLNANQTIQYTILSTCKNCPYNMTNFRLVKGILTPYGLPGNPMPLQPSIGNSQVFAAGFDKYIPPHTGYCAMPNPASSNGPFIGFPALAVNNHADLWALCVNNTAGRRIDVVYSPVDNHPDYTRSNCRDVYLQMSQPYAFAA